ncbi:MAG: hypothetical protein MJZ50_10345 [Treponema sp.]|nr:hypothetical protein [Treponema sp.]
MEFYVNGEKIDVTLESEKTAGDILKSFEEEASKNDATTIAIRINGSDIPPEKIDESMNMELKDIDRIELTVLSKIQVVESLKQAKGRFDELKEKMADVPVALQSGREKEANTIIAVLADAINEFCHTVTLSALFPDVYESLVIDGQPINSFFEQFAPIVADFEESLKNGDSVTSGDLCEYEIAPRLEQISKCIEGLN